EADGDRAFHHFLSFKIKLDMKIYRNSQASLHRVRRRIAIKNLFIFKIKELNKKQTYREKPGTPLAISISTASPMQADGSGLQSRRCPSPRDV
ncbi:hypothetical protein, partial [Achromobacter xylosoxidans]